MFIARPWFVDETAEGFFAAASVFAQKLDQGGRVLTGELFEPGERDFHVAVLRASQPEDRFMRSLVRRGETTYQYEFLAPPQAMQTLPKDLDELEKMEKARQHDLMRKPAGA